MDAFLCRYANQNVHELRGVERLSFDEKWILAQHVNRLLEAEVEPLNGPQGDEE